MQQTSCLGGGPLLCIWPLYLHVNQKSDDDNDDDDDDDANIVSQFCLLCGTVYSKQVKLMV